MDKKMFIQLKEAIIPITKTINGIAPNINHLICFLKSDFLKYLTELIKDMTTIPRRNNTRNNLRFLKIQLFSISPKYSTVINTEIIPRI